MPEHVLMSDYEIITDGGRRRRWPAAEKMRVVEETLEDGASISVVARQNGIASNLLYRWRRLMLKQGAVAMSEDDDVIPLPGKPLRATAERGQSRGSPDGGSNPRPGAAALAQDA